MSKLNVIRLGDPTTHGGVVITASCSMVIEGKPVAVLGDLVSCPITGHGINKIIEASEFTYCDNKRVVLHLCKTECGCQVLSTIQSAEME